MADFRLCERLINRFDCGIVLNCFLMQAAVGHFLIVHGTSGQVHAGIHIQNTVQCLRLVIELPSTVGLARHFFMVLLRR